MNYHREGLGTTSQEWHKSPEVIWMPMADDNAVELIRRESEGTEVVQEHVPSQTGIKQKVVMMIVVLDVNPKDDAVLGANRNSIRWNKMLHEPEAMDIRLVCQQ